MKRQFIFGIIMGAALLVLFAFATAQHQMHGEEQGQHMMMSNDSMMMQRNQMMENMAHQSENMMHNFDKLQQHFKTMMDMEDCNALREEMAQHYDMMQNMHEMMNKHSETGKQMMHMMDEDWSEHHQMQMESGEMKKDDSN